ncbi:hypothetical protein [Kribbella shirazensis]|jgi:hypothetical protein|uniref:Uncharacterized protein n=1 Tax=Kribbella shirazensis TaxID=1105143 RepID=A0A7X5VCF2_9ACTN|nr:hypothetical protein [Kribbella shirazensis]NIK58650.1 hypothetical protein [Kribbella shirazensis]
MEIRELPDRWILSLRDHTVVQVTARDRGWCVEFSDGTTIRTDGTAHVHDATVSDLGSAPALPLDDGPALVGRQVRSAVVFKRGGARVVLAPGYHLQLAAAAGSGVQVEGPNGETYFASA